MYLYVEGTEEGLEGFLGIIRMHRNSEELLKIFEVHALVLKTRNLLHGRRVTLDRHTRSKKRTRRKLRRASRKRARVSICREKTTTSLERHGRTRIRTDSRARLGELSPLRRSTGPGQTGVRIERERSATESERCPACTGTSTWAEPCTLARRLRGLYRCVSPHTSFPYQLHLSRFFTEKHSEIWRCFVYRRVEEK